MTAPDPPAVASQPDLSGFRRAVQLRDRCRGAAVADGKRLGIPLSRVEANVAFDAMVALIRSDFRAQVLAEVDAALRDWERSGHWTMSAADYVAEHLRDTLTGEAEQ